MSSSRVARRIHAPRPAMYRALLDAGAIARWRVPSGMTAVVHELDAREGGSGKTTAHTDTYHGHFTRLVPNEQVVEVLEFEAADPDMIGEMTMTTTLVDADEGTDVVVVHEGVPRGVSVIDNEIGTRMSLDNLAALVESSARSDSPES